MVTVTTAQLKTTIEAALDTVTSIANVKVFDYPRVEDRRKFPSVEIKAGQPEGSEADERITKTTQRFEVTVRVRKRSAGSDDVVQLKLLEDTILPALDETALGQTEILVLNKIWQRSGELVAKPVSHLASTLVVLVSDIASTTGVGQVVHDMTVTFPSLANMKLLTKPVERESDAMESIYNTARTRVEMGPTGNTRTWYGEVEYTDARMTQLRSDKDARAKISFTVHRASGDEVLGGKIVSLDHGGQLSEVETITIAVEVY
jgi:hypothetical protein